MDPDEMSEEELDEWAEKLVEEFDEGQLEILDKTDQILEHPQITILTLCREGADFSHVSERTLRQIRDKINRELEDEEGLTMSQEEIMDTKVKDLTGVEAAKGIKMISKHVERDLQDER